MLFNCGNCIKWCTKGSLFLFTSLLDAYKDANLFNFPYFNSNFMLAAFTQSLRIEMQKTVLKIKQQSQMYPYMYIQGKDEHDNDNLAGNTGLLRLG